ncbi:hypothetical protein BH20ACT2_BH20ACT2_08530 [soil metagenome]
MSIRARNWASSRLVTGLGMALVGLTATAAAAVVVHEDPTPAAKVVTTAAVDETSGSGEVAAPTTDSTSVVPGTRRSDTSDAPAGASTTDGEGSAPLDEAGEAVRPTNGAAPVSGDNVAPAAAAELPAGLPEAVQEIVGALGSLPAAVSDCISPAIDTIAAAATGGGVPGIEVAASVAGPIVDCVASAVAAVPLPFGLDRCTASVFDLVRGIVGDLGSVISNGPAGVLATVTQVPVVVAACVPDLAGIGELPGNLPGLPGLPGGLPDLDGLPLGPAGALDLVDDLLGGLFGGLPVPGGLFGGAGVPVG